MASNYDFLKTTDRKLFEMIETAEQLYRDEYFDQCIVQTRKFAENICKKLLGGRRTKEKTFDDMLATLCDKSTGSQQEKEVIEDLYFIKKEGNNSAHNNGAVLPATTALECLQRAFEVAVNFAFSRNPNKTKLLKLEFDTELLITGEKPKTTLKDKYIKAKNSIKLYEEDNEPIIELSSTPRKKKNQNLIGTIILLLILFIYVCTFFIK